MNVQRRRAGRGPSVWARAELSPEQGVRRRRRADEWPTAAPRLPGSTDETQTPTAGTGRLMTQPWRRSGPGRGRGRGRRTGRVRWQRRQPAAASRPAASRGRPRRRRRPAGGAPGATGSGPAARSAHIPDLKHRTAVHSAHIPYLKHRTAAHSAHIPDLKQVSSSLNTHSRSETQDNSSIRKHSSFSFSFKLLRTFISTNLQ